MLGRGANALGRDEGYDGVILLNRIRGLDVREDNEQRATTNRVGGTDGGDELILTGMGGEKWDDVVAEACGRGYTGIECLSAIPGTLGAAPVQNIGAYGQEIADTLVSVRAYDREVRDFVEIAGPRCRLGYRRSMFNTEAKGRYFITRVTLRLTKGRIERPLYNSLQRYLDEHDITERDPMALRRVVMAIRAEKLPDPDSVASAGSFFKNVYLNDAEATVAREKGIPVWTTEVESRSGGAIAKVLVDDDGTEEIVAEHENTNENKVSAGWLIEQAGLKGQLLHGIRVNEKASLVLINESAESFSDLAAARKEIRQAVLEKFGYDLTQEPVEIV